MEPPHRKKSSSKNNVTKLIKNAKTKKNNGAAAAAANNPFTDDFFDVIDVATAVASKRQANKFAKAAGKKEIEEKQIMSGIVDQHAFTTSKIQQLVSDGFITSKGIKDSKEIEASNGINASKEIKYHDFARFDKVILVDFENLWNVNQRDSNMIISIINTINTTPSKANILFIFIMTTYHRDNISSKQIIASVNKSASAEWIYIDRNVDNLSEPICLDKYGFNESDDYLLLKIFKYLSHFKIPVEILSADQYSYKKNIKITYLYSSDAEKAVIIAIDPFNPHAYYMQFYKEGAKAEAKKDNKGNVKVQSKDIAAPMFLHITGEEIDFGKNKIGKNKIVYYNKGSQYNESTNKLTYNTGLVGSVAANGNIYMDNGMVEYLNGSIRYSNGTLVYPFGKTIYINGTIEYPDGTKQDAYGVIYYPDRTVEYPFGKIIYINGYIDYPDGTKQDIDGYTYYPDGTVESPDGVIEYLD